jgi:outer membrane protein TolC
VRLFPRFRYGEVIYSLLLCLPATVCAGKLPEPLTLESALDAAGNHPALALARADLAQRQADAQLTGSRDDLEIGSTLEARAIRPPGSASDQGHDDSRATLYARKQLYDFGHTSALEASASAAVAGGQWRVTADLQRQRIEIMQAYFDVLLADLEYAHDNELMAVAYVQADRSRDRNELGQLSDATRYQLETKFQEVRVQRSRAQARQRSSRARLAMLLDQPEQLPASLSVPELTGNDRPLPEYEAVVSATLANNPRVLALRADLEAARLQLQAQRSDGRPVLSGSLGAAANRRDISSRNPLEAELRLEIPFYDGGRRSAGVAQAQAGFDRAMAELRQLELDLRQRVLEVWLDIQTLQAQREQVEVFAHSRRLNFDRAQAEYEMELKTDFGDALAGQSESELLRAQTEYGLALDWARLAALSGEPYSPYIPGAGATPTGN